MELIIVPSWIFVVVVSLGTTLTSHSVQLDLLAMDEQSPTALGRLVHDFSCLHSKDIYDETFKECVKKLKETEEGIQTMCSVIEELKNEGFQQGVKQGQKQGLDQGIALMRKLYALGREEDAKRATTDEKYLAQLMKEFAIQ